MIRYPTMATNNSTEEEVEWQRVKGAILRIDQTTREINMKLSHLIDRDEW